MGYTKTIWEPREGTGLHRYLKSGESSTEVTLVNTPTTITQAGTPFTTDAMNNIEAGLFSASEMVDSLAIPLNIDSMALDFATLSQTSGNWYGITKHNSDRYACIYGGDIYKQTGGTGNFVALGQTNRNWTRMASNGTDVYACDRLGDIYKQTGGTGNFVALGQTYRDWQGITCRGTDVYACEANFYIYKQTGGTGNFVAIDQEPKDWAALTSNGVDVYACEASGDIYKQSGGDGLFIAIGGTSRSWSALSSNGYDVYAFAVSSGMYKQRNGVGEFVKILTSSKLVVDISADGSSIYACVQADNLYKSDELSGNTWDVSASFTLPAFAVKTRKRIYNSGSTAITATFPTGETSGGLGYLVIEPGRIVEIEKLTSTAWEQMDKDVSLLLAASTTLANYPTGTNVDIMNTGSSAITITMPSGVTCNGRSDFVVLRKAPVRIKKISSTEYVFCCTPAFFLLAYSASAFTPTSSTTTLVLSSKSDPWGVWNTSSGLLTLPLTAIYNFVLTARATAANSNTGFVSWGLVLNGSSLPATNNKEVFLAGTGCEVNKTWQLTLQKGDTISISYNGTNVSGGNFANPELNVSLVSCFTT